MPLIQENPPVTEFHPTTGIPVHEVKDHKGNLLGHMILIGSLEVVGSLTPLLLQFGLDAKGVLDTLGLAFMTSPVVLPLLLFIDVCGSFAIINLEGHIKNCLAPKEDG